MNKLKLLFAAGILFCIAATTQAQTPQAIKYQAVARNTNGEIMANQNVSFRVTILKGSAEGTPVYQETQVATTNQFGLANLSIGTGTTIIGQFNQIVWGNASYFAKIEFDPKGGNEYAFMGTSQLLSVPYSLYSEHAKVADNLPVFPIKASLQGTNQKAPFDSPETGMLVYNIDSAGATPYDVVPGYYYNSGTVTSPVWTLLATATNSNDKNIRKALALGTNTSYGGLVQDATGSIGSAVGSCGSGNNNTAFGDSAMNSSMSGSSNTGEGYYTLHNLSSGADNSSLGGVALNKNTTGSYNDAIGDSALYSNTVASYNVGNGFCALRNNSYGARNVAIGYEALYKQSYGSSAWNSLNTAIGDLALYFNQPTSTTNGYENTAVGYEALYNNTTGSNNTSVGLQAGLGNTSGYHNTNIGYGTSYYSSVGNGNTSTGYYAMFGNSGSSSSWNTAVGDSALYNISTGDSNTAIGYNAGITGGTLNNTVAVGYGVAVNANDKAVIGNNNMTVIGGKVGWSTLSDGRYKTNVQSYTVGLNFILGLRPVSYNYTNGNSNILYDGFIAQDVEKLLNKLGSQFSGLCKPMNEQDNYSLRYGDFVIPLVNAVQQQQAIIDSLKKVNESQSDQIKSLQASIVQLDKTQGLDEKEIAELKKMVNLMLQAQSSAK